MSKPKLYLGISGVAGSGKDSLCQIIIEQAKELGLNAKRYALADPLKQKINPFLIKECGIDLNSCSRAEKDQVRSLLVAFGKCKRHQSKGQYWTSLTDSIIYDDPEDVDIAVISDIRYVDYGETDELGWLQHKHGGRLFHVTLLKHGEVLLPPNQDEERNDPKIAKLADSCVVWSLGEHKDESCHKYIQDKLKEFLNINYAY